MSTKTSKRRQKRLNTNEEEVEISDKSISPKKIEEHITKETINEVEVPTETIEKQIDATTEEQNGHKTEETVQNGDHHEEKNGVNDETSETTLDASESIIVQDSESVLIVDSDNEDDIQLIVEESPEKEREKSPVLTGMTTRSHKTSPKADKTENGMDTKISNEVRVNITRIEDDMPEKSDESASTKPENKTEEVEEQDTTNASIFVNLGNDTTRNIDITTTSVLEETTSDSFIEVNKDISYGQALRTLSGRRTLRRDSPYVPRFGKTNLEKDTTDARKSYIPHISSVKRKATGEIPDDSKRFKNESPGLFSYISSPITNFRNKISRSELPSSTPKLMSYNKYAQGNNIIEDMSNIDIEEKTEPRKWCSIM